MGAEKRGRITSVTLLATLLLILLILFGFDYLIFIGFD